MRTEVDRPMLAATARGLFVGTSEMHTRVNELDWTATSVGPVDTWPQSLRATIKTLLGSRYPMILLWGPDLIQIYNEAYISLIGDKHPAALGRSIRETQAESWEIIGPMIHEVMSTGVPNWVPAQMLPLERAGYREESYFSLSYSAVDDDTGQISGMLCVCSEVTQRVLGERRLRLLRDLAIKAGDTQSLETACRDMAAAMAEHALDVPFALLYLVEADGKTLSLRGAVGLTPGTPVSPSALAGDEADAIWPVSRAIAGETRLVEGVESRIAVAGGPWQDRVRSALVMPIASAEPGSSLGILIAGVSPNRALDESYSSFYELLAAQVSVAVRNARAHEAERQRAETLAELDRAKTAFFSNVSHEFRTPLTLMLGPLEDLLSARELSADDRLELEVVHRNALRLLRLVNTLLDFSRLEAGRVDASFEPTDVGAFTADLASNFRSAVERAGLTLTVDCAPLSAPAYVDREMWEKIVSNLLSNALKFTFQGGIDLRTRESDGWVSVVISDTGTGIPAAELPHVFERFHRVKGGKSRTHEGTGIGLALVKELVELHGGEVHVSSAEGQGTTFDVRLPLGNAHLTPDRIAAPRRLASTATSSEAFVQEALRWSAAPATLPRAPSDAEGAAGRARPRVLVADDNADMRDYLARVLGSSFDVVAAEDGQAALELVQRGEPVDLILTDVMMPRLGGFGLLKALRDDPRTRAIPLIMLSARAGEEASVEGLEAGADDYLVKPFSARELVARTRSIWELSRMRKELAAREASEVSLRESLRTRDEFISIASHELKTPLTPLQVQIQSLERHLNQIARGERSTEWLSGRLDMLKRQGKRLERLVNELLDVSALTGEELRLERENVSLNEVVADVLAGLEETGEIARSGCHVALRSSEEIIGVWDRSRLHLLVTNLLENALKFGAGTPIDVGLGAAAGVATLTISDGGVGVAPKDHARIFGRFERAVSERHYGGMGLGLWVVERIVEAMGGSVEVESDVGRGAKFSVRVPIGSAAGARETARERIPRAELALAAARSVRK